MPNPIRIGSADCPDPVTSTPTISAAAARKQRFTFSIIVTSQVPDYLTSRCQPNTSRARSNKAIDAIGVEPPLERPLIHHMVQVGERLAEREPHLVPVERPPEQ